MVHQPENIVETEWIYICLYYLIKIPAIFLHGSPFHWLLARSHSRTWKHRKMSLAPDYQCHLQCIGICSWFWIFSAISRLSSEYSVSKKKVVDVVCHNHRKTNSSANPIFHSAVFINCLCMLHSPIVLVKLNFASLPMALMWLF